jgi:hypothetical protein
MANSDKNIRIQPNRNSTLFPKITFTGQSNNPITLNVLDDNSISFEGSSGQLFAINNNLSSGYIFSVNDISGLPSFRINADGTVGIAEYYGNVGIGVTNPLYKFHARGDSYFSSTLILTIPFSKFKVILEINYLVSMVMVVSMLQELMSQAQQHPHQLPLVL